MCRVYSKNGCARCKQRRKKCDETKPICDACSRHNLRCTYPGSIKQIRHSLQHKTLPGVSDLFEASCSSEYSQTVSQNTLGRNHETSQMFPSETSPSATMPSQIRLTADANSDSMDAPASRTPNDDPETHKYVNDPRTQYHSATQMEISGDRREPRVTTESTSPLIFKEMSSSFAFSNTLPSRIAVSASYSMANTSSDAVVIDSGRIGTKYVDGGGARLPRVKRRGLTIDPSNIVPADIVCDGAVPLIFPEISWTITPKSFINGAVYSAMSYGYSDACLGNKFSRKFDTEHLPSTETMDFLVHQYLSNMSPLLPIFHLPTFDLSRSHWLVALALATAGSQFSRDRHVRVVGTSLLEFLRRTLVLLSNRDTYRYPVPTELELGQVQLLSMLCMLYGGSRSFYEEACKLKSHLEFCTQVWKKPEYCLNISNKPELWYQWSTIESVRRLGYAFWLLDTMFHYHFNLPLKHSLEEATIPLPCPEVLFEAGSAFQWSELAKLSQVMPSLSSATEALYSHKYVIHSTGEFSRILLIHAIYRKTWKAENGAFHYVLSNSSGSQQRRSPSPESNERAERQQMDMSSHIFWRDAACDSLDVLHWSANSMIGAASGIEHPTVIHLHFARIILLTPFRSIYRFIQHLAGVCSMDVVEVCRVRQDICDWTRRDQCKARLSIIHAGAVFWHIERYSANGFYEPAAVFWSTSILWAYASCGLFNNHIDGNEPSNDTDFTLPSAINLDRPIDDELVQNFVKHGYRMQAFLTGVGDLHDAPDPVQVAIRGKNLLRTLTSWGCTWYYIRTLESLAHSLTPNH